VVLIQSVCWSCGCIFSFQEQMAGIQVWYTSRYSWWSSCDFLLVYGIQSIALVIPWTNSLQNESDISLRRLVRHTADFHWVSCGRLSYVCQLGMGWLSLVQLNWWVSNICVYFQECLTSLFIFLSEIWCNHSQNCLFFWQSWVPQVPFPELMLHKMKSTEL
jgi:hypothetical protein